MPSAAGVAKKTIGTHSGFRPPAPVIVLPPATHDDPDAPFQPDKTVNRECDGLTLLAKALAPETCASERQHAWEILKASALPRTTGEIIHAAENEALPLARRMEAVACLAHYCQEGRMVEYAEPCLCEIVFVKVSEVVHERGGGSYTDFKPKQPFELRLLAFAGLPSMRRHDDDLNFRTQLLSSNPADVVMRLKLIECLSTAYPTGCMNYFIPMEAKQFTYWDAGECLREILCSPNDDPRVVLAAARRFPEFQPKEKRTGAVQELLRTGAFAPAVAMALLDGACSHHDEPAVQFLEEVLRDGISGVPWVDSVKLAIEKLCDFHRNPYPVIDFLTKRSGPDAIEVDAATFKEDHQALRAFAVEKLGRFLRDVRYLSKPPLYSIKLNEEFAQILADPHEPYALAEVVSRALASKYRESLPESFLKLARNSAPDITTARWALIVGSLGGTKNAAQKQVLFELAIDKEKRLPVEIRLAAIRALHRVSQPAGEILLAIAGTATEDAAIRAAARESLPAKN
jgi:hypothetical protein